MKDFKLKLASHLDGALCLRRWENYKHYKNQVIREGRLAYPKLDDEQREFKKMVLQNRLTLEELKCVIALLRSGKYSPEEIGRIFLYTDI